MFTHALTRGGLRPAEALPPTLTPNAVLAMAPPASRGMSLLGAGLVYAGCGLALALAPKLEFVKAPPVRTHEGGFVVPENPAQVRVQLRDTHPPVPERTPLRLRDAPVRSAGWVPPLASNVVPETPDVLPTAHHEWDTVVRGEPRPELQPPAGPRTDSGPGAPGGEASRVVDFDFRQMRVLQRVDPVYPPLARLARLQGDVVLMMTVDPRGVPTEVRALAGPHPSLEQEAMRVARLWRFEPATLNGQPVSAQFRLTLMFRMR